jgi:hypothetical protein
MTKFIEGLNWVTVLSIAVAIVSQIGNGSMSLAHQLPAAWLPGVQEACGNLGSIGALIVSAGAFGRVPASSVASVPTAMKVLILALLCCFLLGPGSAQAQTRRQPVDPLSQLVDKAKADFTKKTGVPATGDVPFDLLRALDAKLLPDLQYAKKLADATGSKVTSTCYGAWIDMINVQQTAVQTKNADGTTTDLATPDPHLITDFERAVELRNALQPDSPFMVACSPVANMIKQDVVQFMAAVVAGNVSLATLVPGL